MARIDKMVMTTRSSIKVKAALTRKRGMEPTDKSVLSSRTPDVARGHA